MYIITEGTTRWIDDPSTGRFHDPMHKKHDFPISRPTGRFRWYSVKFQNVPVEHRTVHNRFKITTSNIRGQFSFQSDKIKCM
jgi:hypothetical protein